MTDTPSVIPVLDGSAVTRNMGVLVTPDATIYPVHGLRVNDADVADANPLPTRPPVMSFAAGTVSVVTTGGTAVIAITGPVNGGYITNPALAADQGLGTAEVLYVDPVNAPGSAAGAGRGTASVLDPGSTWVLPGAIPAGRTVRVNAGSNGHNFSVVVW